MREGSLMRLVQSFAISHLAYVAAYLNWTAAEKNKLNCMIRRVYTNALGLLARTNMNAMEALGHTARMNRLAKTKTGRAVLEKFNLGVQHPITNANIPAETMRKLDARPILRHMHPEHDAGRRQARAKALTKAHAEDDGAVHDGSTLPAASVRAREVRIAEEVAIALAVSSPGVTTVFSDSMVAIRNYRAGKAMVDALARTMTDQGNRHTSRYDPREYGEIIRNQRLGRRRLPPPHPSRTRRKAVMFRRLQTGCMFTPVFGQHALPDLYQDDQCVLCKRARATLAHITWDCTKRPEEASREEGLPPELQEAIRSENCDSQLQAVQQATALLERQRPSRPSLTTHDPPDDLTESRRSYTRAPRGEYTPPPQLDARAVWSQESLSTTTECFLYVVPITGISADAQPTTLGSPIGPLYLRQVTILPTTMPTHPYTSQLSRRRIVARCSRRRRSLLLS
ncbi:hypothetical protein HPB47_026235 [Ixodes persulcatus]|uniref:Uncharacterized protein n=1 Tax=Ixodes persulcatus TaxID=34615 RepID=A0AC60PZB6_IXOPE|nr:hypothetical protein HPB47_026235 [Ixodes persulcatus]